MSERFNIEALRSATVSPQKPLDAKGEKLFEAIRRQSSTEKTKEEERQALKAEIVRLEGAIRKWVSPLDRFDTLSPEAQYACMRRELAGIIPEAEWDMDTYRIGLEQQSKKNPNQLRLALAREKLRQLEIGEQNV